MASNNWLTKYGLDEEKRNNRIKSYKRTKKWGIGFIGVTVLAMLFLLFWESPTTPYDAYALAVSFGVCISAGFTLISKLDLEIKLCELLDELEKKNLQGT